MGHHHHLIRLSYSIVIRRRKSASDFLIYIPEYRGMLFKHHLGAAVISQFRSRYQVRWAPSDKKLGGLVKGSTRSLLVIWSRLIASNAIRPHPLEVQGLLLDKGLFVCCNLKLRMRITVDLILKERTCCFRALRSILAAMLY
jgi:hypothetical protein